jgi:hypothetical protein
MPAVGFEPTISVFELAETVHASNTAATTIGPVMGLTMHQAMKTYRGVKV